MAPKSEFYAFKIGVKNSFYICLISELPESSGLVYHESLSRVTDALI